MACGAVTGIYGADPAAVIEKGQIEMASNTSVVRAVIDGAYYDNCDQCASTLGCDAVWWLG